MVTQGIRSASSFSAEFGYEGAATFGTETSVLNSFGREVKISGLTWKNNQQPLGGLNTPQVTDFLYNRNEGACSVDHVLSNPWIFSALLNKWYSNSGGGPYTTIWSSDPALNSLAKTPRSCSLLFISRLGGGNVSKLALGALDTSLTLKSAIDQPVSATHQFTWGLETVGTTSDTPAADNSTFLPLNFVNAQVQLPDTTPIADIQSFNLTIENGNTLLWGMNSAGPTDLYSKMFSITGTVNLALYGATYLNDVVNRGPVATMGFDFKDANNNEIHITLDQVSIYSDKWDGTQPVDLLTEEFDFQAQKIVVTATSNVNDPSAGISW